MPTYAIYDSEGQILCSVFGPVGIAQAQMQLEPGAVGFVEVEEMLDDTTLYVLPSKAIGHRPDNPIMLSATTVVVGEELIITGGVNQLMTVTGDGELEETISQGRETITFDTPGTYTIRFRKFPFLDAEFEVTVNAV